MKKIIIFALACAALISCAKDGLKVTQPEGTFVEGQTVILSVNAPQTKVTSALNGTTGAVDFAWEAGDQIKVTIGTKSSFFTLIKGEGTATAKFKGSMPDSGTNFDVQYPATDPDLTAQTYSSTEPIPHNLMKFTATNCTLGTAFTLTPAYAVLRLNLFGGARSVSKIEVTSSSITYTLTCSSAVTVGKDKESATPFFIVLPASASFQFSAAVTANALTPSTDNIVSYGSYGLGTAISASTTFATTSAKTLAAGSILNMAAVSLTTVWAPVNCGYDATNYKYGKAFQWGRKNGCGYVRADPTTYNDAGGVIQTAATSKTTLANEDATKFYKMSSGGDWCSSTYYNLWDSSISAACTDPGHVPTKSDRDPCPDGWRVPTYGELNALIGYSGSTSLGNKGWDSTNRGYWFNGTTEPTPGQGLFLPATGYCSHDKFEAGYRNSEGFYWCSSAKGADDTYFLRFGENTWPSTHYDAYIVSTVRSDGMFIRCVQE